MSPFAAAGFGCVTALALWKGTKERWGFTLIGMFIIALTIRWADKTDFPWDQLIIWPGIAAFTAGVYGLKWYDKRWPKPAHESETPEEPEFHLDVTTERDALRHGWEDWDIFPEQKRLIHEDCGGGPPVWREVYEYAVRDTSVFVRLLEKSKEEFDGQEYQVFGGSINRVRLEEDHAKWVKKSEKWDDDTKRILLPDTPETISTDLQKELVWHEVYGAVRYFVLSKDTTNYIGSFYREELERFTDAFAAIEKKAKELGAVWDRDFFRAPEGVTPEAKEEIEKQLLHVFNFGFRNYGEFLQRDIISGVLKDALGEKHA